MNRKAHVLIHADKPQQSTIVHSDNLPRRTALKVQQKYM